jgi:small-conductance mechanosensitive channel
MLALHRIALVMAAALVLWAPAATQGADPAAPAATDAAPSPKVRELLTLLDDPSVRDWLARRGGADARAANPEPESADHAAATYLSGRLDAIRQHLVGLAAALPRLPNELAGAIGRLQADLQPRGKALLLLSSFLALGFGAEWLMRLATRRALRRLDDFPIETVRDRARAVAARFLLSAGALAAFAIGSVGAFLAVEWPPLLREIVLGYLLAFLALRLALFLGWFLLAPDAERFRIVPTDTAAARFWHKRLGAFVGWFAFGWVTVALLGTLGVSLEARRIAAYALGIGLLAIALEALWRRPSSRDEVPLGARRITRGARDGAVSVAIVLLWALWVARAMPTFWLLLLITVLPIAIGVTQRAIQHMLAPPGAAAAADGVPGVLAVSLERGARALLITGAAAVLVWAWGFDHAALMAQDTVLSRLMKGALSAVVIALLADVAWQVMKAAINRKLAEAGDLGQPNTDEARRRARLRTLLPILRNVLFILVVTIAAMMSLAALGVEIGPLIAGAGVLGVAIGFGSQTLVRDVISGMLYLLDDAFRVGEYIQSGSYKGTVESFSLRSVKLRHHRGPLYTVPFGILGAVQNMSRDWVIDKLTVGVTYDTDLDLVKKLVKKIGTDLAEDPELAPHIIEPLKMQGVEQFGDFAIQIRMKMTTHPGEQFVIRRRAYAMIKKAFEKNGVKFAFPTVQVAGEGEPSSSAAAHRGLELVQPAPAKS